MLYIGFPILSLIYIFVFIVNYYSKKRIDLFENKIVSALMITNAIGLILELCCYSVLLIFKNPDSFSGMLIFKLYIYYMYIFDWMLTGYICLLTNKKDRINESSKKRYFINSLLVFLPVIIIGLFVTFFTKLNYNDVYPKYYTYGLSTDVLVYITCFLAPFWIYRCINASIIKKSREYTLRIGMVLLGIILVGISGALMQLVDRSMLIITSAHSLMLVLIYFTIENPDVKMIQELKRNKKFIEQGNEDKSNFLFRMSQEVKKPVDDILKASKIMNNTDDFDTMKKGAKYIEYNSNELNMIVNNVLDVSKMDTYNMKIYDNTYNVYNIFKELFTRFEVVNKKDIKFSYNISNNMPKILYGDSVKLKQVITTILQNAFDHTKEGFIDVNVDSITKNDACRLIVSIEDSGIGMSIDKVNKLLSLSNDMTDEDLNKLDKSNLDLNIATKIIKLLGGQIIIKSEENVGSEFIITLEQKIKKEEQKEKEDKYSNISFGKKKVLIVDDKKEDIDLISDYLKEYDIDITISMYGDDCIDRINSKQKFDLILMEDEMIKENAINVIEKLKGIKNFKTPVVVMLDKDKETIKKHYVNDGFTDYILKEDFKQELDRVIKHIL